MVFDSTSFLAWLAGTPWLGVPGVPALVGQHLVYAVVPTVVAIALSVPLGLWLGHSGRGGVVAINVANIGRAVPSFGLVILAFIVFGFGLWPVYVTLVALAIPPILTNTYVGIRQVDPEVRDAAQGMGLDGRQVLMRVEVPIAMPVIMAGIRTSTVQVVATATLAAVVGLGGLGRPIINGLAQNVQASPNARALVVTGAVAVAILAVLTELLLGLVQRAVVPRGIRAAAADEGAAGAPDALAGVDEAAKIAA